MMLVQPISRRNQRSRVNTLDQVVNSIIKPGPKKEKNKKKRNSGPVNTKDHDEAQKAEDHDLPRPSVGLQITRVLFVLAAYFWSFVVWGLRSLAKCFSAINDVTYNRTRQIVAGKEGEIVKVEEEQRGASGPKAANYAKVCGPLPIAPICSLSYNFVLFSYSTCI